MTFASGQRHRDLRVQIIDDTEAEAPENFFVNITEVELVFPMLVYGISVALCRWVGVCMDVSVALCRRVGVCVGVSVGL